MLTSSKWLDVRCLIVKMQRKSRPLHHVSFIQWWTHCYLWWMWNKPLKSSYHNVVRDKIGRWAMLSQSVMKGIKTWNPPSGVHLFLGMRLVLGMWWQNPLYNNENLSHASKSSAGSKIINPRPLHNCFCFSYISIWIKIFITHLWSYLRVGILAGSSKEHHWHWWC